MTIIGINGSPRPEGSTRALLAHVLDEAARLGAQTEIVDAHAVMDAQDEAFCSDCAYPCPGTCYEGTELESVYERLRQTDGVVLASPVYFGCASAQIRAFFDKSRVLRSERALVDVVAATLAVGGARFGGQETTMRDLQAMALIHGMTIVGDGHATADAGHYGVGAQMGEENDEGRVKRARVLARRLVEVCEATKGLRAGRR